MPVSPVKREYLQQKLAHDGGLVGFVLELECQRIPCHCLALPQDLSFRLHHRYTHLMSILLENLAAGRL